MTGENKRFKLGYVCGDFGLIDNDEWIDLHSMSENSEKNVQICINKMNELAEENKHLRSIICELEEERDYYQTKCASLEEGLFKADREINMLKNTIGRNESYINRLKHKGLWSNKSKGD